MRLTALRTVTALAAAVTMAACGDSGIERVQLEDENHDGADDHGSDDGGSVG